MRNEKPTIALVMGDPAGIAPELSARLLAHEDALATARIVITGDREVLREGERIAGARLGPREVVRDAPRLAALLQCLASGSGSSVTIAAPGSLLMATPTVSSVILLRCGS